MYEDQTSQVIEKRMLDTVSPAVDKREGSIIHDATAPVSIELELMYAVQVRSIPEPLHHV